MFMVRADRCSCSTSFYTQDARREVIAKMSGKPRPLSLKADSVESLVVTDGQQLTASVKGNFSFEF